MSKLSLFNVVYPSKTDTFKTSEFVEMQRRIEKSINPVIKSQFAEHSIYANANLTANTENWVMHGLGYAYRGWIVVRKYEFCEPVEIINSVCDRTVYLPLKTMINQTVSLLIW